MFDALTKASRLLLEVALKPIQGDRFQPTGFADLGAAVYTRPDSVRMLLVESAQSVANRLELTCLDGAGPRMAKELEGIPYVVAKLTGEAQSETSSLVEAHRLNSPFIISDTAFQAAFKDKAAYAKGRPLDWKKIAGAFLYFDPNSLLHGVFMANLDDGRIKLPRLLTGFIEAEDVREAASGGVKNNPFDPSGKIRAETYDKDVYGNVPYHRTEFTARRITAYFNFDLALLDGFGLEPPARALLLSLGLYKVRRFITHGLRLRTACDLAAQAELTVTAPPSFSVPPESALLAGIKAALKECDAKGLVKRPPITEITTKTKLKRDDKKPEGEDEDEHDADERGA